MGFNTPLGAAGDCTSITNKNNCEIAGVNPHGTQDECKANYAGWCTYCKSMGWSGTFPWSTSLIDCLSQYATKMGFNTPLGAAGDCTSITNKNNCEIVTAITTTITTTTRPTTIYPTTRYTTIPPQPRGGGGGGRMPLMIGVTEVLNNPIVILVALIAIVVIIYGAFKFLAMPKKHR
jgi:hypothetical protein